MSELPLPPFANETEGIVYAVSVDPRLFDITVNLWAYNSLKREWKCVAESESQFVSNEDFHCLMSAVYKEEDGRIDVFLETHNSTARLYRFSTIPSITLEKIFVADNDPNIQYDGYTGPALHYVGDTLIVAGSRQDDNGAVFRIFQIQMDDNNNGFALVPLWMSDEIGLISANWCVAVDNKFLIMKPENVICFSPAIISDGGNGEQQRWNDTKISKYPWDHLTGQKRLHAASLCRSSTSKNTIWMIPQCDLVREVSVMEDGKLEERRRLKMSPNDQGCTLMYDVQTSKLATASSTHLFWISDINFDKIDWSSEIQYEIKSQMIGVPMLQQLCLSKLFSSFERYRECESEEEAKKLKMPVLAWRRFCR